MSWQDSQDYAESLGPMGKEPLREAIDRMTVIEWVSQLAPWDVFMTYTWARPHVSVASASKSTELFHRKFARGLPAIYFVEGNKLRDDGGHHVHALLASNGGLFRRGLKDRWEEKHGFAMPKPIDSIGGVAGYCSKLMPYVTKSGMKGGLWWNVVNCGQVQGRLL
jgi:hypothetical protein